MNIKETAENTWFKLSYRVAVILISGLIANWEWQSRAQTNEIRESISKLSGTLDDFRERQFNPLNNAVTVLQTTIDKGINQALESQNRGSRCWSAGSITCRTGSMIFTAWSAGQRNDADRPRYRHPQAHRLG